MSRSIDELVELFIKKDYLLGMGKGNLSNRFHCSKDDIVAIKMAARKKIAHNKISTPVAVPKGQLLKRWGKEGNWSESYKFEDSKDDNAINIKDVEDAVRDICKTYDGIKIEQSESGMIENNYKINIYIADTHIGAATDGSLYENKYNEAEVSRRLNIIADKLIGLSNLMGKFAKINIVLLGDIIDGMDAFTVKRTHDLPQNMSNKEVINVVYRVFTAFAIKLLKHNVAENYSMISVGASNHGGDFEYSILFGLLKSIEAITNSKIKTKLLTQFIGNITEGDHTFMITHGKDDVNMKSGMPFYINDKTELFILNYIKMMDVETKYKHLIKADLHQNNSYFGKTFRYKNVGSIFGSSDWVMKNFGMTKASSAYDIYDDNSNDILEGIIPLQ